MEPAPFDAQTTARASGRGGRRSLSKAELSRLHDNLDLSASTSSCSAIIPILSILLIALLSFSKICLPLFRTRDDEFLGVISKSNGLELMAGKGQQRSSRSLVRKPRFFKVLLGDFAKRLKIPPNFLKHISMEASRRVILQGPSGSKWHVQLGKTVKGTFLTAGWPKFVKEHSLKEHEFLVFQYDGNMHFTVLIFDTTACEREDVFTVRPCRTSAPSDGRKKGGRVPKISLDVGCYVKNEASESELTTLLSVSDAPNQLQVHYAKSGQGRHMSSRKPRGDVKIKTEDDEVPICMIGSSTRQYKGYVSRRRRVTAEERAKAREAANSFTSIFPYMIMCMTAMSVYRAHMLRFPVWFSRAHLPRKRTNMVLQDPNGKAWVVVYIPSSRDRLSGGWPAFARGNNLEEGDYCAFELVGPVEMRVHIFRVVEEITPLIRMPRMQGMC